jgi:hypothetical protein
VRLACQLPSYADLNQGDDRRAGKHRGDARDVR